MNDKKEVKSTTDFTVTGIINRTVLDAANQPTDGIVIYFTTPKGVAGNIEMTTQAYSKTKAIEMIKVKVEKLEELLS